MIALEHLLGDPRQIDRLAIAERFIVLVPPRFWPTRIRIGEHDTPEAARADNDRDVPIVDGKIRDEQGRIERRPPERPLVDLPSGGQPFVHRVHAAGRLDAASAVRRIEVEHATDFRGRELCDGGEKIREYPVALRDQRAHECFGVRRVAADERRPCGFRILAAGNAHGAVRDAEPRGGRHECGGMSRREVRNQARLAGEPRARLVIEREQPAVEERRAARAEDRPSQRTRRRVAVEDGVYPDRRGERQRQCVGRRVGCLACRRVETREQRPKGGFTRILLRRDRRSVCSADDLEEELAAVGRDGIVEDRQRGADAAGQRHLRQGPWRGRRLSVRRTGDQENANQTAEQCGSSGAQHVPLSHLAL
ncbi:MAG: hypothetical protein DMF84_05960 [Acidobacteria bacterium]|nr:MAG: hypothetical protein DMF84_05960 [Acidobacteriota bacterium]